MSDDETDEGYNEFIKEYGSRYEWDNEGNPEFTWKDWEDLFCEIKIYWNTKAVRHWKEKALKRFVYGLPNVLNPTSLFHVFIQSDAIYLPHILSLIELPYSPEELRWEIWPCGLTISDAVEIEKNRCEQGENSIADYYSKVKRYNNNIKLCEKHLKEEFIRGLSQKNKYFASMDFEYINLSVPTKSTSDRTKLFESRTRYPKSFIYLWQLPLDTLVVMLIQVEKGTTSKLLLQACLDFISQQQRFSIYKSPVGTYQILDKRDRRRKK